MVQGMEGSTGQVRHSSQDRDPQIEDTRILLRAAQTFSAEVVGLVGTMACQIEANKYPDGVDVMRLYKALVRCGHLAKLLEFQFGDLHLDKQAPTASSVIDHLVLSKYPK